MTHSKKQNLALSYYCLTFLNIYFETKVKVLFSPVPMLSSKNQDFDFQSKINSCSIKDCLTPFKNSTSKLGLSNFAWWIASHTNLCCFTLSWKSLAVGLWSAAALGTAFGPCSCLLKIFANYSTVQYLSVSIAWA